MRWIPAFLYQSADDPLHQFTVNHAVGYRWLTYSLWGLAGLLGLGDVLTTWIGITPLLGSVHQHLIESVAFTRWVLETFGPWALLVMKPLVLGFVALLGQLFPRPYRLVFPLLAVVSNAFAVQQNLHLLIQHGIIKLPYL